MMSISPLRSVFYSFLTSESKRPEVPLIKTASNGKKGISKSGKLGNKNFRRIFSSSSQSSVSEVRERERVLGEEGSPGSFGESLAPPRVPLCGSIGKDPEFNLATAEPDFIAHLERSKTFKNKSVRKKYTVNLITFGNAKNLSYFTQKRKMLYISGAG